MSAETARHLREEQTQEPLEKTRSAKKPNSQAISSAKIIIVVPLW